jgi:hypothetical protein
MNIEPTGTQPTATGAIRQAARMTGADFKYLLATAQVESSLNPSAQATSSSARGLFQFIEQTWLSTLKEQGGALGYAPMPMRFRGSRPDNTRCPIRGCTTAS